MKPFRRAPARIRLVALPATIIIILIIMIIMVALPAEKPDVRFLLADGRQSQPEVAGLSQ